MDSLLFGKLFMIKQFLNQVQETVIVNLIIVILRLSFLFGNFLFDLSENGLSLLMYLTIWALASLSNDILESAFSCESSINFDEETLIDVPFSSQVR